MYAQPYSTYKPLNVDWLGEVPDYWEVLRLKSVVHQVSDQVYGNQEKMPYVALEHVESWTGRVSPHVVETPDSQLKQFKSGDVLFGKLRPYLAKVVRAKQSGLCVSEFLVLRATDRISERFLAYLLRSKPAIDWINSSTFGARMPRADWQFVGDTKLPLPSLAEQTAIARFLDYATDQIERYIRAKEKLIALLEEQKQVMIHDAVTGRIDVRTGKPYPAYKPSGVEWLGDVPAHWDVRRLRNVGEALIGLTYDPSDIVDRDDGLLVLRASNIQDGKIVEADNVYVRCRVPDKLLTREGDILLCSRSGSRSLVGKNARIYAKCADVTFGAFMTVFRSANNDFLVHAFNSELFERQSGAFLTSTINQLTLSMLYGIRVPFPPMDEQSEIVCYLNDAITNTTHAIDDANHEIELFREYRTRLIADVVTGKLDVREAAANLPELEAIGNGDDEKFSAESDSQQSSTTLHNEAPPTTPGVGS